MAFNNLISRTDASALIPEEVVTPMLTRATEQSATLRLFKNVPVSRGQARMPVLSALPVAYFVSGDTGLKQTTEANWTNKFLNVEEIATIMPVPENVLDDADADIWGLVEPLLAEALGRCLDAAVFFGVNAPSSWPTNIAAAVAAASNTITIGTNAASAGGYFGDIDDLYGKVEGDGYMVSGWVAATAARSKLRKARDTQGRKLDESRVPGDLSTLDGYPISYAMKGLYPTTSGSPQLFGGDFDTQFVVGVRKDVTLKLLDQAVIQDNTGAIIYNLAQQDMVATRVTFRVGWQVANIVNYEQPVEANRYPVAALVLP